MIKLLVCSHLTFEKEPFIHVVFKNILVNGLNNGNQNFLSYKNKQKSY